MSNQAMCAVWSLNGMLHGKNVFPLCLKTILIKMNSIYPAKRQERIKSCIGRCLWTSALIGSRGGPCVCVVGECVGASRVVWCAVLGGRVPALRPVFPWATLAQPAPLQ